MISPTFFENRLLDWFQQHGRKNLPWQHLRTPYRVWISEIMLQQTQVRTVIPYFEKFMQLFPTIEQLAKANEDSVFSLWGGLGYYTRARHLLQTAKKVVHTFKGHFPNNLSKLQDLPGIGRSTAGAILALGFNQYATILDGNVKRIFARLYTIKEPLNTTAATKQLWQLAEKHSSLQKPCDYTQAIMDFGSIICTKSNPKCYKCPFSSYCLAYLENKVHEYPLRKQSRPLPSREKNFLIFIDHDDQILLEKRPPTGIWGGLWSFPECAPNTDLYSWCKEKYSYTIKSINVYSSIQHTFSHFRLVINPIVCRVNALADSVRNTPTHAWISKEQLQRKGVSAPVKKLLEHVFAQSTLSML